MPAEVYYSGDLWPRYDRAKARASTGDKQAAAQAKKLLTIIKPEIFEDIEGVTPRQGWVPLELVEGWLATLQGGVPVRLVRRDGLVQLADKAYEDTEGGARTDVVLAIGWINQDRSLFKPRPPKKDERLAARAEAIRNGADPGGADDEESAVDALRLKLGKEWEQSFRAWCGAEGGRRELIEQAYQRSFQGFHPPRYSSAPLQLVRWNKNISLHPHQNAGARRVLANRGGLVAFDTGVGKTYTGIAILAAARQEGWCKRPVVLVPNSIVWKWVDDLAATLPDYRVGVVGSKRKTFKSGARKGDESSETDTPAERAETWTRFQAGEFEVVLMTYSALSRTKLNATSVQAYVEATSAIQRVIALRKRNAKTKSKGKGKGELSEREEAILTEGVAAWVAETLELPSGWVSDPGITWEEIACDLLLVDEAQNFKNLYMPEAQEGGVPRFIGNAGEGSNRAWNLDFRSAAVRRRSGGAGVVLLSATPAKNSPLEFYSLLQMVDHDVWRRMGILNPQQFIDRYLRVEQVDVVDASMSVVNRAACTGFENKHELRGVIERYAEYVTAEQAGLKLPEEQVEQVAVDLDAAQEAKYERYVREIEEALENPRAAPKGAILSLLARMALVAIHSELDEKYTWKTARHVGNPHSPKFDALAVEIKKRPGCGHIVFCDNVAAHYWMRMVLLESGIEPGRIAILNAEVAEAAADRQRIAREFNGDAKRGLPPKYDVVIANAIAYEGVDLQTRTCSIHHIDLPWEPATLQQRNGRGHRQGNTLSVIHEVYYFARRSLDGMRFSLIQGKRGWMVDLLTGSDRRSNNPGAQMQLGPLELLMLISRDPEKTRERYAEREARRAEEARGKIRAEATATLRSAAARFWRARGTKDPVEAARLRGEGEQRLEDLGCVDEAAWPWAPWAVAARDHDMLIAGQVPVYHGLRVAFPDALDPSVTAYGEFGQVQHDGKTIGVRRWGSVAWNLASTEDVTRLGLRPEHRTDTWPEGDDERMDRGMRDQILPALERERSAEEAWKKLGWSCATEAFVERAWVRFGARLVAALSSFGWRLSTRRDDMPVPRVAEDGALVLGVAARGDAVIAPTKAGWASFLRLAPTSGLKFAELARAGSFWFGRSVPRGLLVAPAAEAPESRGVGASQNEGSPPHSRVPPPSGGYGPPAAPTPSAKESSPEKAPAPLVGHTSQAAASHTATLPGTPVATESSGSPPPPPAESHAPESAAPSKNERATAKMRQAAEDWYNQHGERHAYTGLLSGLLAVLRTQGLDVERGELSYFHVLTTVDPAHVDAGAIAKGLEAELARGVRRIDSWNEPYLPRDAFKPETLVDFGAFEREASRRLQKGKIRRGSKAYDEFYALHRAEALKNISSAAERAILKARTDEQTRVERLRELDLAPITSALVALDRSNQIRLALLDASGLEPDPEAEQAIEARRRELVRRRQAIDGLIEYRHSQVERLSPEEVVREGMLARPALAPFLASSTRAPAPPGLGSSATPGPDSEADEPDLRDAVDGRDLAEIEGLLASHGYPPEAGRRLQQEGMGPLELERRLKEPGGLTRTHGLVLAVTPKTPERPVGLPGDDLAFAGRVILAARASETGRFGEDKVFISHVARQLKRQGFAVGDLEAFKSRLVDVHRKGLLSLSRADLVEAMDPKDVEESEARYFSATFHFVRII